ncbi:TPA: holin [Citrobacter freundii]
MHDHERTIITLGILGGIAAASRVLAGAEPITLRLFVGRTLLGSALGVSAAALLVRYPNLDPLAIAGLGTAMGVAGYQIVEIFLSHMRQKLGGKDNKEE